MTRACKRALKELADNWINHIECGGDSVTAVLGGYDLDERGAIIRQYVDASKPGDYGADPLPDGMFRMVPSGDIVNAQEKKARLGR